MAEGMRNRELVLPPGTYAYVLDMTKGIRSETLDRTINLLVQGLRAGGDEARERPRLRRRD